MASAVPQQIAPNPENSAELLGASDYVLTRRLQFCMELALSRAGRRQKICLVASICILSWAGPSHVRGAQTSSIIGSVTDRGGAYWLAGVSVTARLASGGQPMRATSGSDGIYRFDGLITGTYRLDFEVQGFDITRLNRVRVVAGAPARADAQMYPSSICECVERVQPVPLKERTGRVVDDSDRPLPHARLTIGSPVRVETAYADGEGGFRVRVPVDGTWPLTASDTEFGASTLQVSASVALPIVFRLKSVSVASVPASEYFNRGCRCPGDLFTHPER